MLDLIGEIRMFAGNYAPQNWAYCNGQLLNIQQYRRLFDVIGTTYGGNGTTDFALPNLQNKTVFGVGAGQNITARKLGDFSVKRGSFTLTTNNLPPHKHTISGVNDTTVDKVEDPTNAYLGSFPNKGLQSLKRFNNSGITTGKMHADSLEKAGVENPAAVEFEQPFLSVGFAICLSGDFPIKP